MTLRRALLLSFVVLILTALILWPNQEAAPTTTPQCVEKTADSLRMDSSANHSTPNQTLLQKNTDGTFSTKHPETIRYPNSRWTNPAKPVDVVFPRRFSEAVAITSGSALAQCVPFNANPNSQPEVMEDQSLIYRDAFPGCDVKYKSLMYKTEEFIVVKSSSALDAEGKVSWSWDIQTRYDGEQLTPRLTPMHTIELTDEQGVPRLRIDAPFGLDSTGTAVVANKHLSFTLKGTRLTLALNASELRLPLEIDPSFSSTGTMAMARLDHSSTVLPSGKILVVGGLTTNTAGSETASCELYDPSTKTWQATGNLGTKRHNHDALLLSNGKVLTTGGAIGISNFSIASCELFDPSSGTWTSTGSMSTVRRSHTSTLLNVGKVLVTGGLNGFNAGSGGTADATTELYDVSTGIWSNAAPMSAARWMHSACLLGDGRVLIEGGYNAYTYEIYDPNFNTWSNQKSTLFGRYGHSTVKLSDGNILIAGGGHHQSGPSFTCEIYDPLTDTRSQSGAMIASYPETELLTLGNGRIMAAGSNAEFYNVSSGLWGPSGPLNIGIRSYGISLLNSGDILFSGGFLSPGDLGNPINQCFLLKMSPPTVQSATYTVHGNSGGVEINVALSSYTFNTPTFSATNPAHGQLLGTAPNLTYKSDAGFVGGDSFTFQATDGAFGSSGTATIQIQVTNVTPNATAQNITVSSGDKIEVTLSAIDPDDSALNFSIVGAPLHGILIGTAPNVTYTPDTTFSGLDSFTFHVSDGLSFSNTAQISIQVVPSPPVINSGPTAFPNPANVGESIQFGVSASDIGSHTDFIWEWDFGDGFTSVEQNPSHAYTSVGDYVVTLTVTDAAKSSTIVNKSVHVGRLPIPRFTTSDVVGFEGLPFTFDASLSTDPENSIVGYSWNFGDGTPNGNGQVLSKVYEVAGTYTVTLTILDAEGLQSTTQRLIEILSADQIGFFNAFVEFKTSFDRNKTEKDSITLKARLNVGDSQIGAGSAVALEIAGQRFAATLDGKFRATVKVAPKQTWKVQFATRKQSAGQVDVQVTIKNADLGLGFNQLGALAGGDGSASITVPVRLEVGAYSFEIPCDSDFDFNKSGTKAKGEGASE